MVVTALFVSQVANGIYTGLDREPPSQVEGLLTAAFFLSLMAWFWSYCADHRLEWLLDMGWFLMVAWPIVVPYYLIKHERRRGLARVGLFLLTYFAAWAVGWAVSLWTRLILTPG
jgi:hypothetical protein